MVRAGTRQNIGNVVSTTAFVRGRKGHGKHLLIHVES